MTANQTQAFKPLTHTHYPRASVGKYDFHQGNPYFFGDHAIPCSTLATTKDRSKVVAVIINHKDRLFFVGHTTSAPQYIYNYGRFFAIRDSVGVSTHVRDRFNESNKAYWSIEFLKAQVETEKLVADKLKGWTRLGGYVHTDQPDVRNLIRATHTATGWSAFFTMGDRTYISDSIKRWGPLREIATKAYQNTITPRRDLVRSDLMHEYLLLMTLVTRDAQTGIGFSFKIIESADNPSGQARITAFSNSLNGSYQSTWSESQRIGLLAKHFKIDKNTTNIGVFPSNVPPPDGVQMPDPYTPEIKAKKYIGNLTGNVKLVMAIPTPPPVSKPIPEPVKELQSDVVLEYIDVVLPDPIKIGNQLLDRMNAEMKRAAVLLEYLAVDCDLGINAFCKIIAETIASSTVLCHATNGANLEQIESTVLANTLPQLTTSFTYLETLVTVGKAVHQSIKNKEIEK